MTTPNRPKRSRWHNFLFFITFGLLLVAIGAIKAGFDLMEGLRSADEYQDQGVVTFIPKRVIQKQEEMQGTSRVVRSNRTKTVTYLEYWAQEHSGWRYRVKRSASLAREDIKSGSPIERRVFTIKDTKRYITTEPEATAESYARGERGYVQLLIGLGGAYCAAYFTYLLIYWRQRRKA